MTRDRRRTSFKVGCPLWLVLMIVLICPIGAVAQTWRWTTESVDVSGPAAFTSLAVDHEGNVHVSYAEDGGSLKYAFRSAFGNRWFTMLLDSKLGEFATNLALDSQGNPHICYTPRELKYAYFDGAKWKIEPIARGETVEYNCSIRMGSDDVPQVLWFHTQLGVDLHLQHAILRDGVWIARTVDLDGMTGKWNSMVLDGQGHLHLTYSVFPYGILRSSYWDGTTWSPQAGILPEDKTLDAGMGNSVVLTPDNHMEVSFYEGPLELNGNHGQTKLKFARQQGTSWTVETVDSVQQRGAWVGYRSTLVLDGNGLPHICYEDGGALKHAYSDGTRWHVQVVVPRDIEPYLYSSMAIGRDNTLYISYRDATDGSLKVAIGRNDSVESTNTTTAVQPEMK